MSNDIYSVDLLRGLPPVLKKDAMMRSLATAIGEQLQATAGEIDLNIIYARIDSLPEAVLDILAYDFKVDWWGYDYSLEEKRRTMKDSWKVLRTLGTKAAVETAISAIYPDTHVQEWFDYDGDPYHFKLLIDITYQGVDPQRHQRVLDRTEYYKNVRSVLDEVEYVSLSASAVFYAGAAFAGGEISLSATAKNY